MHYLLYVEVPGFYVREWERRDPERAESPIAVHRDKRVLDANSAATRLGVRPDMGLEEAKALLQGVGLILFEEEPYREAQKRWLDILCDFSSVIEPDRPHSAWIDLSGHPQPFDIVGQIRREMRRREGVHPILGLAGTKWLAQLAAELLADSNASIWEASIREALLNPRQFIEQVPTSALFPIQEAYRERLKFLGYRTAGEVAQIPLRTLKGQFGLEAQKIASVARGRFYEPVAANYPPDQISLKESFEEGLSNLEDLRIALERIARHMAKALSDRESQGATVHVRIGFETDVVVMKRTFSNAIRTARQAFAGLYRVVGEPTEDVFSIEVQMPNLRKASERQGGLFVARTPGDDVAVERAVDRVRHVFGDSSVIRASERVEPRRVRVLRAWSHATGWK